MNARVPRDKESPAGSGPIGSLAQCWCYPRIATAAAMQRIGRRRDLLQTGVMCQKHAAVMRDIRAVSGALPHCPGMGCCIPVQLETGNHGESHRPAHSSLESRQSYQTSMRPRAGRGPPAWYVEASRNLGGLWALGRSLGVGLGSRGVSTFLFKYVLGVTGEKRKTVILRT